MATATAEKTAAAKHLIAYTVKTIGDGRTVYTKIGAAFPHKEGPGFNLDLDAVPYDRRIVVLPPKNKGDGQDGEAE